MTSIRFRCNCKGTNQTTNECYDCRKHNNCELFIDMISEEDDRARDEEAEERIESLVS